MNDLARIRLLPEIKQRALAEIAQADAPVDPRLLPVLDAYAQMVASQFLQDESERQKRRLNNGTKRTTPLGP